ncbi:glycine betaine/L-proline ABC transporter ATP-binding protein ProV [Algiphilus sp.]|uniref:glycine betaine/L-proline ABC transporter ATP-binding protein ProV n=1 Tax=Algiphilus sp. TaxID=1872431 RepID=UPI001CA6B429|nr:glycine betaine/L-proline ABC transporter ATP-binding protein ProV [Algiphilus sp.]MBY8964805.1 glycine betaine/L-proline ABC transporter ATP-binding protein ProV [Algiphilus acroporae]MCI5063220.1 glycine betaine/L-proline ABC transporter ATP-binding protein ProV [Algiphilus sp.]MCI5103948.1 glycine betaine/L-proline ABC transporter ATP-binding protein ProV [Algiphilus sp.]MCR9090198.1 glycine betaine/L-proline ABC transporter ATP-binding protein ProV [Pseudomonadota bacterium]
MDSKLAVQGVYKVFGGDPREALERIKRGEDKDTIFAETGLTVGVADASFSVEEGEVFVVMGLSGSGKSTMVRMLNRLIEPSAGSITLNGRDITRMSRKELIAVRRRSISMVFQSFALMPHQTVLQNTAFGLNVSGMKREEREKRAMEALDAVGLKANADSYPDELSGGMKQRVGLARALATDPEILLMDEAFSALDPLIRTEMQDELLRLQSEQARTVVFITHDLDEAMRVGDRIAIMEGGRVVQIGTPDEIVRAPANDYVRSFFRGVDVSHVFTAGDIARRDQLTVVERSGMRLRAALSRLDQSGRQVAVVNDRARVLQGVVTVDSIAQQLESSVGGKDGDIESAFIDDPPILASTPLTDIMTRVAESPWPVPVVDDEGHYVGAISRATLLLTLDRQDPEASEEEASHGA